MSELHQAWADREHAVHFDALSRVPGFVLRKAYERFNEIQMLNEMLDTRAGSVRFLEVGCATGELYRYLRSRYPRVSYVGCDISKPALERARQKYPGEGRFVETDVELRAVANIRPDIVFCRDVAHHQPDPVAFIRKLYDLTNWLLVMRIRTRDEGVTVRDVALSCQLNYGVWAPFIIVNSKEIIEDVQKFIPRPSRVQLTKHHMVLGGQYARFLPKECYFEHTGGAESALVIEKCQGAEFCAVSEETRPEKLQLPMVPRAMSWLARR